MSSLKEIMEATKGNLIGRIIRIMEVGAFVNSKIMFEVGRENHEADTDDHEKACLTARYACLQEMYANLTFMPGCVNDQEREEMKAVAERKNRIQADIDMLEGLLAASIKRRIHVRGEIVILESKDDEGAPFFTIVFV